MIAASPVSIDGIVVTITAGMTLNTQGRLAAGDKGPGEYFVMTSAAASSAGINVDNRGEAFTADNGLILVLQWQDRALCTQFGIFPDEVTDWRANGFLTTWLLFLSNNDVTGVFVSGFYASPLDNFNSNVSIYGEPGAIFGGVVHVAINPDITQATLNRPQNVTWMGECATFERVGTFNCDNVYIEKIRIKEDVAKSFSGFRGAGVHISSGSRDMYIGSTEVDASERSFGLGVDFNPAETTPANIHFGKVYIKKSYVHGVSLVGDNIHIDDLTIDEYGAGNIADPNITFGMANTAASTTNASGLSMDNSVYCSIGKARINQKAGAPTGDIGCLLFDGVIQFGSLIIRDAIGRGFQNTSSTFEAGLLDVRTSGANGINNASALSADTIIATLNTARGVEQTAGSMHAGSITASTNGTHGVFAAAGTFAVERIIASSNNTTANDFNVSLSAIAGHIGSLNTSRTATGLGGGVELKNDLSGLKISNITTLNDSDSVTGGGQAALLLSSVTGLSLGAFHLQADGGASAWQPLRLLTLVDVNLNGGVIENEFNSNGVAAGTLTRVGFMNCNNATGVTNISAAAVSEFNSTGMAT
jgi:hypothetical protein